VHSRKIKHMRAKKQVERALLIPRIINGFRQPAAGREDFGGVVMRIRQETDMCQIQDLDYIDSGVCSSALTTRLLARIARRPGRWRRRMQGRQTAFNEGTPIAYDDAA
jgi:hypothetical protein